MDYNKMGAIASLGSFLIAAIIFGVQVWPWPQLKGRGGLEIGGPKALVIFLLLGFLLSSVALYGAFHKPDFTLSYGQGDLEVVRNQLFAGKTVELDGKRFEGCTFDHAELVFHGTKHFDMVGNTFRYTNALKVRLDNPGAFAFWQLFMQTEEDNQWLQSFDVTLTDSNGNSISNAVFNPVGHIQVVPKP